MSWAKSFLAKVSSIWQPKRAQQKRSRSWIGHVASFVEDGFRAAVALFAASEFFAQIYAPALLMNIFHPELFFPTLSAVIVGYAATVAFVFAADTALNVLSPLYRKLLTKTNEFLDKHASGLKAKMILGVSALASIAAPILSIFALANAVVEKYLSRFVAHHFELMLLTHFQHPLALVSVMASALGYAGTFFSATSLIMLGATAAFAVAVPLSIAATTVAANILEAGFNKLSALFKPAPQPAAKPSMSPMTAAFMGAASATATIAAVNNEQVRSVLMAPLRAIYSSAPAQDIFTNVSETLSAARREAPRFF